MSAIKLGARVCVPSKNVGNGTIAFIGKKFYYLTYNYFKFILKLNKNKY